jgi:hypothetical protein
VRLPAIGLLVALGACAGRDRARSEASPPPPAAEQSGVADSLVLTAADGAQVWLVEGRPARDSAGSPCHERGVEIRRDSVRIRVPLLFTGTVPTALGRAALRAELWRDCRVMAIYRVDLATGRPTKLEDR